MKNSIVWLYWENALGQDMPAHIDLCHKILMSQDHGCNVILVTPDNVHQYLPDLDPAVWDITLENINQNPIAVRCAFIRAFLLERYGGLYVDSDCLALVDYKSVFDEVVGFDFFAMRRTSAKTNHISIGFYGSVKQGVVISKYCEALRAVLKKKTLFRWAEVGAHLVTPIVNEHLDRCYLFREDRIHPVVAEKQELLADEVVPVGEVVPNDAVTLMLFHRIFEQEVKGVTLKGFSMSDLAKGNYLLSRVIKHYGLV
ncbi:capsular polysaccharide synthesis protein [Gilvimarinus agarilyticus]|uniref:capsular polysaccharide synthesis protein n=1 Tax=Gilvimarinus agarilyticus TaxID=679259 RepID=UPI00059F81DC|nr:capsular polysaccharide synthesis protein [Gilvimarinus agarilyticus]